MNENEEIKVEDAMSVLEGKPTINERLDKIESMMEMILTRLSLYDNLNSHTHSTNYYPTVSTSTTVSVDPYNSSYTSGSYMLKQ